MMNEQRNKEMSFMEHLEELRWCLIRSFVAITALAILAFILKHYIFDTILFAPGKPEFITNRLLCHLAKVWHTDVLCINQIPMTIISRKISGQFSAHMIVSIISGIVMAFPYVIYECWRFIAPAFNKSEKHNTGLLVFTATFLFYIGLLFSYYILVPISISFFATYSVSSEVLNQPDIMSYISFFGSLTVAGGIVFELPILVYFLSRTGIITSSFLRSMRKYSVIVILIIAAIITPPDVFSQILVAIPLLILYEISIFISKRVEQTRKR